MMESLTSNIAGDKNIDVSIVIVSYNTSSLTSQCLEKVEKHLKKVSYEVIVVDNASTDGSPDMIAEMFPWVHLICLSENRGFAGGNIPGMKKATGRYVLLLNSDAFLTENVVENTISYMDQRPKVGILGCKLTNPDGSMQPSARMLPSPLNKILHITGLSDRFPDSRFFGRVNFSWWNHSEPRSVGWVVGAYFLIRRAVVEAIGFLDPGYFLYFEEIDYCLMAKRVGWDVVFYPYANVVHLGGQSAKITDPNVSKNGMQVTSIRMESELRYYNKLYGYGHALLSAAIECVWNMIVLFKNMFLFSKKAFYKRIEAAMAIRLMITTLKANRWRR